ncbi:MAG: RNA 2',3'-cyclic phosphodiesterase, partial [Burkholderiaceae bacterium]
MSLDLQQRVEHRRATQIDSLHLTLAFIPSLADDAAVAVAGAVTRLRFKAFDWQLDTIGSFREARVVWAGSERNHNAALLRLAQRSRQILDRFDVDYDHKPLAPHVTLLRGVRRFDEEAIARPLVWR